MSRELAISNVTEHDTELSRRGLLQLLSAVSVAVTLPRYAEATVTSFDITQSPFNADQNAQFDATAAIQAALNEISKLGRGKLIVPSGNYLLSSGLTCTASLKIEGDGQASSVFIVKHTGVALTVNCIYNSDCVTIRDVGFSPVSQSGAAIGTALALNFPAAASGWQHCSIENVDLGVPTPDYTTFTTGIAFTNLWRGHISSVNMHSNIGSVDGTVFMSLNGETIDSRFSDCSVDGIDTGFQVNGYSEGVHVKDTVVIGNRAISTGSAFFRPTTTPPINLLGLFVSGCEFNCKYSPLDLFSVDSAQITGSHFRVGTGLHPAVFVRASSKVIVDSTHFAGDFDPQHPSVAVGLWVGAADGWASNDVMCDNCTFTNLLIGVQFALGTYNSTALGIRMLAPGEGTLQAVSAQYGAAWSQPYADTSGNTTNHGEWLSSVGATMASPRKLRSSP